ncbi:hypothetical protein BKK49_04975 [Rodentibacter rarus]|uniref:Type IV secretion system putative lipoprotein virB7 n=1 Tax=Rodentibacter rarus TaxID=1908260 RepID=A0A1V3IJD3_9PAST|nr:lipoprotein [Rodentibacter rarus]OOF41371.1 hypothetical protein BKK50_08595 [Rodentibacter rarus]OOF41396.1 hypothetical protein BKK49_04975 [Rodentibacter rarus]
MKKYFLLLSSLTLLTGCAQLDAIKREVVPPSFTAKDFIGMWYCSSSYGDWNIITKEYYDIQPNGMMKNTGTVTAPLLSGGIDLKYEYSINAYWQIDGWYLVQKQAGKGKVVRKHDPRALAAMNKDPKLKQRELKLYNTFKNMASGNHSARRQIESVNATEFTTLANTSAEICSRVN